MNTGTDGMKMSGAAGQDERLNSRKGTASKIVNMRRDRQGYWISDRGWEPMHVRSDASYLYLEDTLAPVRFLATWNRQAGESYTIFERSGKLQYEYGGTGGASYTVTLAEGRTLNGATDPGTQMVTFGRFALFLNGSNAPLKFFGDGLVTSFGFTAPPPPPTVLNVDPSILLGRFQAGDTEGVTDESCAIGVLGLSPPFLGDSTEDSKNSYSYKVSLVSDTGSESPMSSEITVSWSITDPLEASTFAVCLSTIPTGGDNIIARRIYRTKNMGDGSGVQDRTFYFLDEIPHNVPGPYFDTKSDSRLTVPAPEPYSSAPLQRGFRFGASFDGRLWLGGGSITPSRIVYSDKGLPEQFGSFSYMDLGAGSGPVTQLVAHGGVLYVFRERGIDMVTITEQGLYRVVTVTTMLGTSASNTIRDVPGIGLVFLSRSGFYAMSDGKVSLISAELGEEMKRIVPGTLARATAAWSAREGEYWCHYPADGTFENSRGAVLHAYESTTKQPVWSLRNIASTDESRFKMCVTAICPEQDDWFVMGMAPIKEDGTLYAGKETLLTLAEGDVLNNVGLQIWSASPTSGKSLTVDTITTVGDNAGYTVTSADSARVTAEFVSEWFDFDQLARVVRIEAQMVNTGRPDVTMEYAIDGRETWTAAHSAEMLQAELSRTTDQDHLYADDEVASRYGYEAVWGSSLWREDRYVNVRWDVSLARGSVKSFRFRLRSTQMFGVVQYRIGANGTAHATMNPRDPGR